MSADEMINLQLRRTTTRAYESNKAASKSRLLKFSRNFAYAAVAFSTNLDPLVYSISLAPVVHVSRKSPKGHRMSAQRSVLVVYEDPADRHKTVLLLQGAGYSVAAAANFEEAKQFLASQAPDVLITDLRLGSYNGLHLVLRSRADHPDMAAFVTSHSPDPVLEAEAQREQARFLLRPIPDKELLDAITLSLAASYQRANQQKSTSV